MIKLIDIYNQILKEAYIDKLGNLIDKADFVILEGGMRGGIFKSLESINPNDYINFTTKLKSFRKKDIATKIYNQIIGIYNTSALKKYNDSINFTPSLDYDIGGGWDASGFDVNISPGVKIEGVLEAGHYFPDTGFDEFIKGMRGIFGVEQDDTDETAEKIKNTTTDSERKGYIKDLEDKIMNLSVICIPKYNWGGKVTDQIDVDLNTKNSNFGDEHNLYSKSDLLRDLNETGLFLISNKSKSPIVELNKTNYKLYVCSFESVYTGYRNDGSSYKMKLGNDTDHLTTDDGKLDKNFILVPKNENLENFLKKNTDPNNKFSLYSELYGWEDKNSKDNVKVIKKEIKELPNNIKISLDVFNYLKKKKHASDKGQKIGFKNEILTYLK